MQYLVGRFWVDFCGTRTDEWAKTVFFDKKILKSGKTSFCSITPDTETRVKLAYRRVLKSGSDIYKKCEIFLKYYKKSVFFRASLGILVGADIQEEVPALCQTNEDWLWIKLNQVKAEKILFIFQAIFVKFFKGSTCRIS